MPIYEYDCPKCGKCFTVLTLGSSQEKPRCPECKSEDVRKRISGFSCGMGGGSTPSFGAGGFSGGG